jgi:hypothetical protein
MGKPDKAGRDFLTNENRIGRHDGTASEAPRAQLGAGVPEANAEIQSGDYFGRFDRSDAFDHLVFFIVEALG